MPTFTEIRDKLTEDYIKEPRSPQNKLIFDEAISILDFAEATHLRPREITSAIDTIIHAHVGAILNLVFRISGITINHDPTLSADLIQYMSVSYRNTLREQSIKLFVHQIREGGK